MGAEAKENSTFISHGSWSPRSRGWEIWFLAYGWLPSLCVFRQWEVWGPGRARRMWGGRKRGSSGASSSFNKDTNHITRAPPSWPNRNIITSPWSDLQVLSNWGLGLWGKVQHTNFEEYKHSVCNKWDLLYPTPRFPRWWYLAQLEYNIKARKLALVQSAEFIWISPILLALCACVCLQFCAVVSQKQIPLTHHHHSQDTEPPQHHSGPCATLS